MHEDHFEYIRSAGYLRQHLQEIADKTQRAMEFRRDTYARGKAEDRRFKHDRRAGRHSWTLAKETAVNGLTVLDRGELEKAAIFLWVAEREYIAALEAVLSQARVGRKARQPVAAYLATSAKQGGRPSALSRDQRLAKAVKRLRGADPTLTGKAARSKALDDDPSLDKDFHGRTDAALRQALRRKNG
jgi:hypothetical protein